MIVTNLPKQPPPFISYLKVGKLLYYSLILFVIEAWFYGLQLRYALLHQGVLLIILWIGCFFVFIRSYFFWSWPMVGPVFKTTKGLKISFLSTVLTDVFVIPILFQNANGWLQL